MRCDAGSVFTSQRWFELASSVGVELGISGIESHNSLGIGERYHAPLRQIFRKIMHESPHADIELALKVAIKTLNDTLGPEGLVPSLLVFGLLPRPVGSITTPNNASRQDLAQTARSEYDAIVARLRIARALKSRMSAAANKAFQEGDLVSVYRDRERRFVGAFAVTAVDGKQVFVRDQLGRPPRAFNVTALRHAILPDSPAVPQ
jgi:hypothetical protein